jgi:CDP-diacylglycerol--glycerol-3-phosphate 3-phosphatidyltransferase
MVSFQKINRLLSHPNALTLYRVAAVPGIVVLLYFPKSRICTLFAALLFGFAAITDYFDGFFARRRGMVSNLGKVLDPLADKLLVSCAFIMMAAIQWIDAWIVCIIIGRELAVTGLRNLIAYEGEDVSASWLGKCKTSFQIGAIIPLMVHYPYFGVDFDLIGTWLLWAALFFTIWSGIDYFIRFRKLLKN